MKRHLWICVQTAGPPGPAHLFYPFLSHLKEPAGTKGPNGSSAGWLDMKRFSLFVFWSLGESRLFIILEKLQRNLAFWAHRCTHVLRLHTLTCVSFAQHSDDLFPWIYYTSLCLYLPAASTCCSLNPLVWDWSLSLEWCFYHWKWGFPDEPDQNMWSLHLGFKGKLLVLSLTTDITLSLFHLVASAVMNMLSATF